MSARSKPAGEKVQVGLFVSWPATQVCCAGLSVENPVKPSDPRGLAWLKTLFSWRRKSPPIDETPVIVTADGGVIGASGVTYDSNGNAIGYTPQFTQSCTYN